MNKSCLVSKHVKILTLILKSEKSVYKKVQDKKKIYKSTVIKRKSIEIDLNGKSLKLI